MAKKKAKSHRKKSTIPKSKDTRIEKALIENFVSLQKVITNLSINFEHLSDRISKLLDVFEISAKALAEKDFSFESDNKEVLDKMDELMEQNRTLARGLTLMHEINPRRFERENQEYTEIVPSPTQQTTMQLTAPKPSFPQKPVKPSQDITDKIRKLFPGKKKQMPSGRTMPVQRQKQPYEKSIASKPQNQQQEIPTQDEEPTQGDFLQEITDDEFQEY